MLPLAQSKHLIFRHGTSCLVRKSRVRTARAISVVALFILVQPHSANPQSGRLESVRPQDVQTQIPRVERGPRLEDFLDMRPSREWEGKLAHIEGFVQRAPDDGKPATQPTEAYLAYDQRNLYLIFVAYDREPERIRARLDKREGIALDEDQVGIYLDTFHDGRRAYQFECNPLGVQDDSMYSEDTELLDGSFDTVWASRGQLTPKGYVVWMSIPFKSLRFPHSATQTWRVALWRWIGRRSEGAWWPRVTFKKRGILSQAASIRGIEGISSSRNWQWIPYASGRAFHTVDNRDPNQPVYQNKTLEGAAGMDTKIVLKDSLVLDLTAKPDFSQVESDDPQVTVNQRFEVFYPEKRPFFNENANYFDVPISGGDGHNRLLFTRRIADPDFGARLTGKVGNYSLGALFADDKSPGESVPVSDPMFGQRAYFGVGRILRDLPGQSSIGAMYTERRLGDSFNRVFDLDSTIRLDKNWTATLLGASSWTRLLNGSSSSGRDMELRLNRQGRGLNYDFRSVERAPDFLAQAGYIFRDDLRALSQDVYYQFWPQQSWLTKIMPEVDLEKGWFYNGGNAYVVFNPSVVVEIKHLTTASAYIYRWNDGLRPKDYPVLTQAQTFHGEAANGFSLASTRLRVMTFSAGYEWGTRLNYIPPNGQAPALAKYSKAQAGLSFQNSRGLSISNTYLFDRNLSREGGQAIYNSHIIQSKWNWQLNHELSIRFIAQYNALITAPQLTSASTVRRFNADFLVTYLVHPGTAIYIGYNSNLSRPGPPIGGMGPDRFVNDGRQFFVKASYLFRF